MLALLPLSLLTAVAGGGDLATTVDACLEGKTADWLREPARVQATLRDALRPEDSRLRPGNVRELNHDGGSFARAPLGYAVQLPLDYGKKPGPWPLVLTLPEAGETPEQHLRDRWHDREFLKSAILVSPSMPEDREAWSQVVVLGAPGGLARILTTLRLCTETFDVDPDRVLCVGTGEGGNTALEAGRQFPQRFAGIACRASDAGIEQVEVLNNLPIHITGGGANSKAFAERCEAANVETVTLDVNSAEGPLTEWLLKQRRQPRPTEVRVVVGKPFPTRCYWVGVAPIDPATGGAYATARLRPEANSIVLTGAGVSFVTLYLSDEMLDLDQPIALQVNGELRKETVRRSLRVTRENLLDGISDTGSIYTAQLVVDLRAPGEFALPGPKELAKATVELMASLRDPARAEARGWAEQSGEWVAPEDRARMRSGDRRDPRTGLWSTRADRKREDRGAVRVDDVWVDADEAENLEKGRFPVDGEWCDLDEANRRHTRLDSPWVIPTAFAKIHATTDRSTAIAALVNMARTIPDLERALGLIPPLPLDVILTRTEEQADRLAFGDPDGRRAPLHGAGRHVIYGAYFAERRFERDGPRFVYDGAGVGIWNAEVLHGDAFGVHSSRLAYALSWVDAIDPSPNASRSARKDGPGPDFLSEREAEKRLPAWLTWGAAVYAERFYRDTSIDLKVTPDADPWWTRAWSVSNLIEAGGLGEMAEVFEVDMDPAEAKKARLQLLRAGALVAFILDGDCAPVRKAHAALKAALIEAGLDGPIDQELVVALEGAIRAHEAELRAFLGA
ncbi:hypothetical protein Poly30_15960 [Planctomycetes bacterium Poly30]|uniref:Uncharacterized protein n=1 Tax=Saltatorellus ferox TaxID=2528018 RepID=A0A518EPS5_9BACT|nr:hypothetical protein Poly30_15960 [Planctomycetes bacterium Poly30]